MKLFAVSIHDAAAGSFHAPLFFPALGMAERWFKDECNSSNPDSALAKHPSDYVLYLLGTFDTEDGDLVRETPRQLFRGENARPLQS